jgi:hypothetical protein
VKSFLLLGHKGIGRKYVFLGCAFGDIDSGDDQGGQQGGRTRKGKRVLIDHKLTS